METTATRQVYGNAWMTVREDTVVRPDGTAGIFGVVDKPTYALIIPLDRERDRIMLVEQYRYPVSARRWEFPQGTAPDRADLDGVELAARELREETGLVAARLDHIGMLDVAPGLTSQRGRVYVATGLTEGPPSREVEEQDMRTAWFSVAAVETMIRSGELSDAQSVAAYALLLLHTDRCP